MRRTELVVLLIAVLTLVSCANPAQAEIDRADDLLTANKLEEARAAYEAALALDPDNPDALAGRGCSRPLAQSNLGMADLDKAIELDPQNYNAHRCRAEAHREAGDLDAALADATKAVERIRQLRTAM
jgi:tetratricopeptide (TPR) repeat protein